MSFSVVAKDRASLVERRFQQVPAVAVEDVERVVHESVRRLVVQGLERRTSFVVESDDLPVDECLLGLKLPDAPRDRLELGGCVLQVA